MNGIPNLLGMSLFAKKKTNVLVDKKQNIPMSVVPLSKKVSRKSDYAEDVDLLVTEYNDKAFLYNSGKVDIIKNGNIKTVKFKSKKDAALYLMKTGWKYV